MIRAALLLALATPAAAESVVPVRTIAARTVIAEADLALVAADVPGALMDPAPRGRWRTRGP